MAYIRCAQHKDVRPIRVMLVDDQVVVRLGIAAMLKGCDDLILVGEAADGEEALHLCEQVNPDIILMDLIMAGMDGVTATRAVLERYPSVRIIVVSGLDSNQEVVAALEAGAVGYLLKDVVAEELAVAIRLVSAGLEIVSPKILKTLTRGVKTQGGTTGSDLTEREKEVLSLLIEGCSNLMIAERLIVGPMTVKSHVSNILSKLQVSSRTEAVALALRQQLLP